MGGLSLSAVDTPFHKSDLRLTLKDGFPKCFLFVFL